MIRVMSRFVLPLAASVYVRLRQAAPGSDAIVHSFLLTQAGYELARIHDIPDFSAQMFPMFAPTSEFSAPGFPARHLPAFLRRWTHVLFQAIFRRGGGLLYGRMRRSRPDLPPLTGWPFSAGGGRITPLLFGFSEHVVPRPRDWPEWTHITGYWQNDRASRMDADLLRFLEYGPPPVFIGFGSYTSQDASRLTEIARGALMKSGQRGIVSTGKEPTSGIDSRDMRMVGSIPHRWLFPRMAAVVHHGGAGTTGAGLRAGIPNIIVPFTADQPFWAERVRLLGAGPEPIPLRKLTAKGLAAAIDQALRDEGMKNRCRELGKRIDMEDGVANAVELIIR
jgi:UDP:flavonoid glycosyltransferase YjiC (YdhE family)